MDDTKVKLEVFEEALWNAYNKVQSEERVLWCSLHKVQERVGLSRELFSERLNQLWKNQFTSEPLFERKYDFGLEVDCTPVERHRLRNRLITVDGVAMFIINMGPRRW
jgi:hypothetical protein